MTSNGKGRSYHTRYTDGAPLNLRIIAEIAAKNILKGDTMHHDGKRKI